MPPIDRVRRGLLLLATSWAAGGLTAAHGKANPSPRAASDSAKLAGAFVNWGSIGRERTLQDWEKWLNQKPSSVIAVDFYGAERGLVDAADHEGHAAGRCRLRQT